MENNEQQKTDNVQCVSEIQKNTGESNATASFVLGLVGLLLGFSVIVPLILGIIGADKYLDLYQKTIGKNNL